MSQPSAPKPWVLVASEVAIAQLAPLIEHHRQVGPVRVVPTQPGIPVPKARWEDAAAILWVDTAQHSPRTGLPAWFLPGSNGEKIPVGWLPNQPHTLATYAQVAINIHNRTLQGATPGPLALLGSRDDRTQTLLDRVETLLREEKFSEDPSPIHHPIIPNNPNSTYPPNPALGRHKASPYLPTPLPFSTYRWSAERLPRGDLLYALGLGLGAALYLGHGFPTGWHSYAGLNLAHLHEWQGEPLGTLFCITCHNASRHQTPLSFAETLVLSGRCGVVFAATGETRHAINQQFALRISQVIPEIACRSQSLTLAACLQHPQIAHLPLQRYRILGDPTLPMTGSLTAPAAAARINAPSPEDTLPPLSPALWQGLVPLLY